MQRSDDVRELLNALNALADRLEAVEDLDNRLKRLALAAERVRLGEVLLNYTRPRRIFWLHFLGGLSRGLGLTVGTAIVIGVAGYLLSQFVNVPLVGEKVAHILEWVEYYRAQYHAPFSR